mmetsp:Transcript_29207/g.33170  ORF Transcript_29207/g.33170 Transcript_29207/m.33170 type:complete len:134 (-) Transcript_29207:327-728(-)
MSVLKARIVPQIVAEAGITLKALPAAIWVTEITPDSKGESVLETMDCNDTTSVEAATIGSMVRCGMAACPPLPCNTMVKSSAAAIKAPGLEAMVPVGSVGHTCIPKPNVAFGSNSTIPSSTIRFIPAPPSSAG